ncbi:MAG: TIR domain-containing protein [Saprospiraceae bacterium]
MKKQRLYLTFVEEDLKAFKKFRKHLSLLEDRGIVEIWSKDEVLPGTNVEEAIKKQLNKADMVLFLISIELLTDPDIRKLELKIALQRVKKKQTKILPILYRRCAWTLTDLGKFQPFPSNGRFVDMWQNEDNAWTTVVEQIYESLQSANNPDSEVPNSDN